MSEKKENQKPLAENPKTPSASQSKTKPNKTPTPSDGHIVTGNNKSKNNK